MYQRQSWTSRCTRTDSNEQPEAQRSYIAIDIDIQDVRSAVELSARSATTPIVSTRVALHGSREVKSSSTVTHFAEQTRLVKEQIEEEILSEKFFGKALEISHALVLDSRGKCHSSTLRIAIQEGFTRHETQTRNVVR